MVYRTQNFHNFVKVALTKQPKRRPTSDKLLEVSGNTRSVTERQNRNSLLLQHIQSLQWPSVLRHCWLGGRKSIRPEKTEWWGVGMVICLEQGADLHMAQLMPLPLTISCFSKIQMVLPFWYQLTQIVLDKAPLNGCVCVLHAYSTFCYNLSKMGRSIWQF